MQTYSFTVKPIADALIKAKERDVNIQIIFDKDQLKQEKSAIHYIKKYIPIFIDNIKGYAHNKIIIIDQQKVITGSYNHSNAAENRNAENIIIINNKKVADSYIDNWYFRKNESYKLIK